MNYGCISCGCIGFILFVGLVVLLKHFFSFVSIWTSSFTRTSLSRYNSGNSWAVVTGASDGIGKSFATQLAKNGFNIVLISRTESKLIQVAEEIGKTTKVSTKVIAIDFSNAQDSTYNKLFKELSELDIGILVNNVGYNLDYPQYFNEVNEQQIINVLEVNVKATTRVTYCVLPLLLKRKKSLVINLSSMAALFPTPLLSVYSATKSYISTLSKALYAEYKPKGIDFVCLTPAFVVSAMSKRTRSSLSIPSSDNFARSALKNIGKDWSHAGYWFHDLMIWGALLIPEKMFIWYNKSMHEKIKQAFLRKQERLNKNK